MMSANAGGEQSRRCFAFGRLGALCRHSNAPTVADHASRSSRTIGRSQVSVLPWMLGVLGLGVAVSLQFAAAPIASHRADLAETATRPPPSDPVSPLILAATPPHGRQYGKLPLLFETNRGQVDAPVDFVARGSGYTMLLAATGLAISSPSKIADVIPGRVPRLASWSESDPAGPKSAVTRVEFAGADPRAVGAGLDQLAGHVNYFLGADPDKWRAHVEAYAKVRYQGLYPGVDLVYYGNQRQLEFDFVVAAGADPAAITLNFDGELEIDEGDLLVRTPVGPVLRLRKPSIYQDSDHGRSKIAGRYAVDHHLARFQIDEYDRTLPLIIDPVLVYSARLGGRGDSAGYAIAVDAAGNAYVTGDTTSVDFPAATALRRGSGGSTDVFVTKLSPDGRLVYASYLGGSGSDGGAGIAIDAAGNAYVTGDTRSMDFPLVKPLQPALRGSVDVFVAKLSADGSQLIYSTYFGGTGGQRGLSIAVDGRGNAYVTGYTNSTDFPTANAVQNAFAGGNADAFVLKLNASGSALVYSTYLGGGNDRPDMGAGIAADADGNAYVTGFTNSPDFPTAKPLQPFRGPTDAFVTKISPDGSALVYSTHLGGKADDEAMAIAVDSAGSAYVTGHTESPDFPTTPSAFRTGCTTVATKLPIGDVCAGGDAFVSKLSPDGSSLVYSTYLNASRFEVGRSIAVDAAGNAYVTGFTSSPDFPTVDPVQQQFGGGDYDAFVVKLNPSGSALSYSSYLGGRGEDGGYGIAVDGAGNAYVTGITNSPDFPATGGLRQRPVRASAAATSAFMVKIDTGAAR